MGLSGGELKPEHYRAYLRVLAASLLRRAGPLRNKISASDVVQDALLQAHVAAGQFHGSTEEELVAWLRTILANKLTDAARRFGRQKRDAGLEQAYRETIEDSAMRFARIVPADQTSPSQHLVRAERLLRLGRALDGLPEEQRIAVEMRHVMGCSVMEIAEEMNRTRAGVAGLLRRGLKSLRSSLASMSRG